MGLVGFSMPSLFNDKHDGEAHRRLEASSGGSSETMPPGQIALHVFVCTILMNAGKLFHACCSARRRETERAGRGARGGRLQLRSPGMATSLGQGRYSQIRDSP